MKKLLLASAAFIALGTTSYAADIPAPMAAVEPMPVVAPFSWTGFYLGVNAGGAWTDQNGADCDDIFDNRDDGGVLIGDGTVVCDTDDIADGPNTGLTDVLSFITAGDAVGIIDSNEGDDMRWLGGAQIGVNQQYGALVLGLEADFAFMGGDGGEFEFDYFNDDTDLDAYDGTGTISTDVEWLSTFRARLGGAFGPEGRFLGYLTGGVAVAGLDNSASFDLIAAPPGCALPGECVISGGDDDYAFGYVVGLGGEYAFSNRVSVGLEYLYAGFDDDGDDVQFQADEGGSFEVEGQGVGDMHIARFRVNYLFGGGN
jgi:outer membrane immunogenic protein